MQDKNSHGFSSRLDAVFLEYQKISEAPKTMTELLHKHHRDMPDFQRMPAEHREAAQVALDEVLNELIKIERQQRYKSTDGHNVYLIANPLIWPIGPKGHGLARIKPKYLGPLEKSTKSASKREIKSLDYDF